MTRDLSGYYGKVVMFPYKGGEYPGAVRLVVLINKVGEHTYNGWDVTRGCYRSFATAHIGPVFIVPSTRLNVLSLPKTLAVNDIIDAYATDGIIAFLVENNLYCLC